MLIKEIFPQLKLQGSGLVSVAVPDIYMKMPYEITNRKGKVVTKQRFTPIAAVVAMSLKEDEEQTIENVVDVQLYLVIFFSKYKAATAGVRGKTLFANK